MFWKKKEKVIDYVAVDDNNFDEIVTESHLPVLIDFWAPWCGPCKMLGPIVDELATEFKDRVLVAKVNVDGSPGLSNYFKVKSIPTLMFVKNGKLVERLSGMVPKPNLEEMLEDLINLEVLSEEEE
ncbi:MAG: thioredoxin [Saprospiraceae bacterium]|nr:thioredoxin [Saprospiraceae bacterium]|tara:strand:+ start:9461 stop:9838 length:378 start_codon:yes stop_codon:yes gene_type:complete